MLADIIREIDDLILSKQLALAKARKDFASADYANKELFSIVITMLAETIESLSHIRSDLYILKAKQNV